MKHLKLKRILILWGILAILNCNHKEESDQDKKSDKFNELEINNSIRQKKIGELSASEKEEAINKLVSQNSLPFLKRKCRFDVFLDEVSSEETCRANLKGCEAIFDNAYRSEGAKILVNEFFTKCSNLVTGDVFDYTKKALQFMTQFSQKSCADRAQFGPAIDKLRTEPVGQEIEGCFQGHKSALRLVIYPDYTANRWVK
jgi:hypothetical protein